MNLKIFGFPRAGTNFTVAMLQRNIKELTVDQNTLGWKHAMIYNPKRLGIPLVTVVKSPFAHLVSLYRYSLAHPKNDVLEPPKSKFPQWLRSPIIFYAGRTSDHPIQTYYPNPVAMWAAMTWHYVTISSPHGQLVVDYEALLKSPDVYIEEACKLTSLERNPTPCPRIGRRLLPSDKRLNFGKMFDPSYYMERKYLSNYSLKDISFIRKQTPKPLMKLMEWET